MALLGCRLIGLEDPTERSQIKRLLVYVEMDRCAADAIAHVTGVKLGRRSLKFTDYGIMAATFVNLESGSAFRVLSTEEARELVPLYAPGIRGKAGQQLEAYRCMPDSVLFRVQQVRVPVKDCDLPGPTRYKAICSRCGQVVRDRREVLVNGEVLCKPCALGAYFKEAKEITWPEMNWTPASAGVSHRPRRRTHLPDPVEIKAKRGIIHSHEEIPPPLKANGAKIALEP